MDKNWICDACGEPGVQVRSEVQSFLYGEGGAAVELNAVVPVYTCGHCGLEYTDEEAETLRHEAVCHHEGVLTPTAIRGIRDKYDVSREEFAEITGIGVASLARWETGGVIQNKGYDRLLRLTEDPEIFSRLKTLAAGGDPLHKKKSSKRRRFPSLEESGAIESARRRDFRLQAA